MPEINYNACRRGICCNMTKDVMIIQKRGFECQYMRMLEALMFLSLINKLCL